MELRQKILIVDDKSENLFALEKILNQTGAEVVKAGNGNDALIASLNHDFAVAILDVQMPSMSGYELAEYLRNDEKTRNLPIIFLTAVHSDEYQIFRGYEAGAVDFITKPFDPRILVGKVKIFLELDRQRRLLQNANEELERKVEERTAELQSAYLELEKRASSLEALNEELTQFAFVASHDLQEPLRKIQTFCDLAQKRCTSSLDTTTHEYLDRVANSANRMRHLLHDLLEFSRVSTRVQSLKEVDLAAIAHEAAGIFESSLKETGFRIEIDDLPRIEADENQMMSLFQNLIGNSLKYRGDQVPHIKIRTGTVEDGLCEIVVEDNGIGFEQEYSELIFKPFQRLHGRDEYSGTGMGLTICRKIVERYGGTIRAESKPGQGSAFILRLPVRQSEPEDTLAPKES